MRRRALFVFAAGAVLASAAGGAASAGYRRIQDADDFEAKVDVKWAAHGHAGSERLRHGIGTYGAWGAKALRAHRVLWHLDLDGGGEAERQVRLRYRNGRLRAAMFKGEFFRQRVPGRVTVRRPNRRSAWVSFGAGMLGEDLDEYRWMVVVYEAGTCPGSCPVDTAPRRGWVRHPL